MTTLMMQSHAQVCFLEFNKHLMEDDKPSVYFNELVNKEAFPERYPFTLLTDLIGLEQSPLHHPEGDVWNHTMLVVDNAAQTKRISKAPRALMWAALLHDIGKKETTKLRKGRITAYDHDKAGQRLAVSFLKECEQSDEFAEQVGVLVRWHMQALYATKNLPFFNPKAMNAQTDVNEVALLCLSDRLGRGPVTAEQLEREQQQIASFVEKSLKHR
jgi:putative nucleotidyltransferase with HDIG domain